MNKQRYNKGTDPGSVREDEWRAAITIVSVVLLLQIKRSMFCPT